MRGRSPETAASCSAIRRWCSRHSASAKLAVASARTVRLDRDRIVLQVVGGVDAAVDVDRARLTEEAQWIERGERRDCEQDGDGLASRLWHEPPEDAEP